jgi:hypothetical protein
VRRTVFAVFFRSTAALAALAGVACGLIIGDEPTLIDPADGSTTPNLPESGDAPTLDVGDEPTLDVRDAPTLDVGDEPTLDLPDPDTGWTPDALAGLSLWLDSKNLAIVDGGIVWKDRSPSNADADAIGNVSIAHDAIGHRRAAHVDFGYLRVTDRPSLQFGTGDFLVALVARHTTRADSEWRYGILFSKQNTNDSPYFGASIIGNNGLGVGCLLAQVSGYDWISTPGTDYNKGIPFVALLVRSTLQETSSLALRVNGSETIKHNGAGFGVDVSEIGHPITIGGTARAQSIAGDVAEVIVVRDTSSDDDINHIEAYLLAKYQL